MTCVRWILLRTHKPICVKNNATKADPTHAPSLFHMPREAPCLEYSLRTKYSSNKNLKGKRLLQFSDAQPRKQTYSLLKLPMVFLGSHPSAGHDCSNYFTKNIVNTRASNFSFRCASQRMEGKSP